MQKFASGLCFVHRNLIRKLTTYVFKDVSTVINQIAPKDAILLG
jgi:hypothetical protein